MENKYLKLPVMPPTPNICKDFIVTGDAAYILHNSDEASFLSKADLQFNLLYTKRLPYTGLGIWQNGGSVYILGYDRPPEGQASHLNIYSYKDEKSTVIEIDTQENGIKFGGAVFRHNNCSIIVYAKWPSLLSVKIFEHRENSLELTYNYEDQNIGSYVSLHESGSIILLDDSIVVPSGITFSGGPFFISLPLNGGSAIKTNLPDLLSEKKYITNFRGKGLSSGEVLFWGEEDLDPGVKLREYPPNNWWFALYDPSAGKLKKTAKVQLHPSLETGAIEDIVEVRYPRQSRGLERV